MSNNQQEIKQKEELLQQFAEQTEESTSPEEKLIKEISDLQNRYENIKKIDEALMRLDKEIAKFGGLAQDPQRKAIVSNIKTNRFARVFLALKEFGKMLRGTVRPLDSKELESYSGIKGTYNIVFMILCIFITTLAFLSVRRTELVIVGFVFLVWYILLFVLSNFFEGAVSQLNLSKKQLKSIEDLNFEDITRQFKSSQDDSYLVNSAWIDALQKESSMLQKGRDALLENKSMQEFESLINQKKDQLSQLQHALNQSGGMVDTDRLKKEIDILKLEEDLSLTL